MAGVLVQVGMGLSVRYQERFEDLEFKFGG
jgi:hypothetical protein